MSEEESLIEKFGTMTIGHISSNEGTQKACKARFQEELKKTHMKPKTFKREFSDLCPDKSGKKCKFWIHAYKRQSVYKMDYVKNLEVFRNTKGIAPRVLHHFWCNGYGIFVREMWDGDLVKFCILHPDKDVAPALMMLLKKMHQQGWVHREIKANNIVYRKKPDGDYEFAFINFKKAKSYQKLAHDPDFWEHLLGSDLLHMQIVIEHMRSIQTSVLQGSVGNASMPAEQVLRVQKHLKRKKKKNTQE